MNTLVLSEDAFEDLKWLRRFATMLAQDTDEADDLVQDTLMEAWRTPPQDTLSSLRPWLATVLRNRFRMRRRGAVRRETREVLAASNHTEACLPDREHERLEVVGILLSELQRLAADDQKIIVRRFFEGESAAEIGRDLRIPSATIRSRIRRSLQQLRSSLDRRYGTRDTWCATFIAMPNVGVAKLANTTGSITTMSITTKVIIIATLGGVGATGWAVFDSPPETPALAPRSEPATHSVPAPHSDPAPAARAAATTQAEPRSPRAVWERRRNSIHASLPAPRPSARPSEALEILMDERRDPAREALREFIAACMDDLGNESTGSVTLAVRELGAPGVGTIYEHVKVVDADFDEPEVVECLTQSMYSYVGDEPAQAYAVDFTQTILLGKPEHSRERKDAQVLGAIVGAHLSEVRFCESKAAGPVEGTLSVTMTMSASGRVDTLTLAEKTQLPEAVAECILAATKRWKFPTTLAGKTFEREFVLPVPGK